MPIQLNRDGLFTWCVIFFSQIKKKQTELERNEKRLKTLQNVRPAFMDEYEKLEQELQRQYDVYMVRFRNLEYLENELDLYNQVRQQPLILQHW